MSATPSNMISLGTQAPIFTLFNTITGKNSSLAELRSNKATVIMFICNHCPFVVHINAKIVEISNEYSAKGISFIGISSNDAVNNPQDAPDKMKIHAAQVGYNFPYLYDETQEVAKAYDAACTPDFFVYNKNMKLIYRGQFDNSRPGNGIPVSGNDLSSALDRILNGREVDQNQIPSIGCNIKWK